MQCLYRVNVTCLEDHTQSTFACLKSTLETPEQRLRSA